MILRSSLLALTLVCVLVGCSAAPDPAPTPTATPTPTPTEVVPPTPTVGMVGSGTLAGVPFTVEWDGTDFGVFGLSALDVSRGTYVYFTPAPAAVGDCLDGFFMEFDVAGVPPEVGLPIYGQRSSADATYLHGIAQVDFWKGSCLRPVVASATIDWTMAPLYPDLAVTDSGDTGGARGVVTLDGTTPVSDLVHQGDVFAEVAARFGISPAQLFWLNPRRSDLGVPSLIKEETLNLSPSRR